MSWAIDLLEELAEGFKLLVVFDGYVLIGHANLLHGTGCMIKGLTCTFQ
jgi:hypothetical protein